MPDLPLESHRFYIACDPGLKGAIALMSADGKDVRAWPMPTVESELDLSGLVDILRPLARLPDVCFACEWPTAWPESFGDSPAKAVTFGKQLGTLKAFGHLLFKRTYEINPILWKGRLGLDGKTVAGANERARSLFETFYPEHRSLVVGPRGGLLDGPLDALLIAHFLRTRQAAGMKSIAEKFGKGSDQAMAFILGGGRRRRKFGKRNQ